MTNLYNSKYTSFVGSDRGYCGFRTRLRLKKFTNIVNPKPGQKILEIGCNQGQFSRRLSQYTNHVYGIDINSEAIKQINHPNFRYMSATNIDHPTSFFDKICAFEVIEHIQDTNQFLTEVRRILKNKGQFIISFPFEIIRGQSALLDSLNVFGDIKHGRQLHIHKFFPKQVIAIAKNYSLKAISSRLVLAPFPTYVVVFTKNALIA